MGGQGSAISNGRRKNVVNKMKLALKLAVAATLVAGIFSGRPALNAGAASATQSASKPQIENARVEPREIKAGLTQEVDAWARNAEKAQWLGYSVPAVNGDHRMCCGDSGGNWNDGKCGPCRLESGNRDGNYNLQRDGIQRGQVKLEGSDHLVVLFRAEGRKIRKIRAFSEECVLDAGGLPVTWLTGAKPAESVKLLERFVDSKDLDERGGDRVSRGALMAIAMHGDAAADQAFANFTAPDKPETMRREAAFWAGEARGAAGVQLLRRMAKEDPNSDVRAQVAFALSISHESNALDEMIRMAHEDSSGHVRGQALFWLAQKAGNKASSTITGAIDNDPDTEVKKKAVFALSQMPKDDGVPKLIQVAETNRNPEVRKQAMFWLGQSNDPRALEFFEKILAK
jgi:HEAT repeat protein/DNA-binding transcriptional regulator YdaS (Cro superfamily)